jgi:hypothetical protein
MFNKNKIYYHNVVTFVNQWDVLCQATKNHANIVESWFLKIQMFVHSAAK